MSALFKLKSRRIFRGMKSNSLHSKASGDEHLIRWGWLYAALLVAAFYLGEWAYRSGFDAVPLRLTKSIEVQK
jgi:hypothetical protein